ncbi:MAG: hypothetical protein AOA66_0167 [Candidatus Bathyarchaeota archaeon BA2]|nr:MAG: hypothetical protein AOA66_0167 [Candidatus Bathyarchaeota archaeon BA2]
MADFETEKYRFWFCQDEKTVRVDIAIVEGRKITDEDVIELKDFFNDIENGKLSLKLEKISLKI